MPRNTSKVSSYDTNNIFARILKGDIDCNKVYEDNDVLAFHDVKPLASVHIIVIPKASYQSYNDFVQFAEPEIVCHFFKVIQNIANQVGIESKGYRLVTNSGSDAEQEIMHFHVHILGGERLGPIKNKK